MIRVLQVVNNMHRAGLETMLMNYYRHIDREKIQFDFLTHRPEKDDYDDEIESMGGVVYHAPRLYPQNYPAYFKFMKQFFVEHSEYKIIHSHIDTMSFLPLLAGKKAGISVRIAHSHNTSIDKDFKRLLKNYFRSKITTVANYYCACGEEAGQFLFQGKEFDIIPNAVEAELFSFNEENRKRKRKELQLADQLVIGHIGRISYQKNHKFLIEIFHEILKMKKDAILLLIGIGEKELEIIQQVHKLGIENNVRFLGSRSDVDMLYQAMDVFVLPSLFEGIPVVGVEAQFANLSCFFSNKVPKEVDFSGKCKFVDLKDNAKTWAETIVNDYQESKPRSDNNACIKNSYYDIEVAYKELENYYCNFQM